MHKEKIRFGLVGLGGISAAHELGYREKIDRMGITAVCDLDESVAAERARPHNATAYTDYRKLIDDSGVDAVDIMLPHNLHYPVARYALEQKKHVIVEKPISVEAEEGLVLIELAAKSGLRFTVAENTRFVKAYRQVENLVKQGVLGEPRFVRTFISGSEVWRLKDTANWKGRRDGTGGGALLDAGAHSVYLIKWLLGEIDEVHAYTSRYVSESQVEDGGIIVGQTKSGAFFSSEFSFVVEAPWDERLEFHGSLGSIIVDQLNDPPAVHFGGCKDIHGTALESVEYNPAHWKTRSIANGVKDFVDAIWDDRPPSVDPMDACYAVKVINAAYSSASEIQSAKI